MAEEVKKTVKKVAKKTTAKKTAEKKSTTKKATAKAKETKDTEVKKPKTSDRTVLLRELKEKAAKLAGEIKGEVDTSEIKEEFDKQRELLIPLEDYVRTGIHLGTKVITPDMKKYVYRRRADSIGVLNTSLIDENIKKAIDLMKQYKPEQIILACKREAGWKSAMKFEEVTGIKSLTKRYPGGMMTNLQLEDFYEPDLVIVCDPWVDRNALGDAKRTNKKVIMLSDTNNFTKDADLIIPCNNKGAKSLGLVFWLLAKGYLESQKQGDKMPSMFSFTGEDLQEVPEVQATA